MQQTVKLFLFFALFYLSISCAVSAVDRSKRFTEPAEDKLSCQNIISASKPWMGTVYKYGGNSTKGVDCSGFVQQIYRQVFDIKLPRTTEAMYNTGSFVRDSWLKCADLLFFKNVRGRGVDHVGIYIGDNRFIHASNSKGVVISDLTSDYYVDHFVSARRYVP
jgi:cell wall-associated NlpC family hydrolase